MLKIRKKYVDTLIKKSRRDKVRAFFEYRYDIQTENKQSLRTYAKEWGVGKTTAHGWITEFIENGFHL